MLNGLGSCGGGRSRTSARQPSGYSSQARLRKRAVAAWHPHIRACRCRRGQAKGLRIYRAPLRYSEPIVVIVRLRPTVL